MPATYESPSVVHGRSHAAGPREAERVLAMQRHGIDTSRRPDLRDIVACAARRTGAPIAAVTVLHGPSQHVVASVGADATCLPRELSFCTHVTERRASLVVRDAARDPYFAGSPAVSTDGSAFQSYCGVPVMADDGCVIAVLCVIDNVARDYRTQHVTELEQLARTVADALLGHGAPNVPEQLAGPAQVASTDAYALDDDPLFQWIERNVPRAFSVA